jgi:hypothetical protein
MRIFGLTLAAAVVLGLSSGADAQVMVQNALTGTGVYVGPATGYTTTTTYDYSPWAGTAALPRTTTYYSSGYAAPGMVGYAPGVTYRTYTTAPVYGAYAAPIYPGAYGYPVYGYRLRRGLFGWRPW